MKILKQEKEGNKVKLEVEFPSELVKSYKSKAFKEVASGMAIPGFRKGKAPKEIIEKNINMEAVNEQAIQDLLSENYSQVISETKIEPVDFPEVVVLNKEEGKPITFSISVEVYPEVKLGKYKGVAVKKLGSEVKDKEIDDFIDDLKERFAKITEVTERAVESEDLVVVDLETIAAGAGIEALTRKAVPFVVGKSNIVPQFDKEIVGLTVGADKEFKLAIPEDHPIKEIAGKEANFKVSLKRIAKRELPPFDQSFVSMFSSAGSPEKFREEVKQRLIDEKTLRAEEELKNEVVEKVSESSKVDVPSGMIRRETDLMVEELERSLEREKLTLQDYLKSIKKDIEKLREELKPGATKRVMGKITLKAIAEKEEIKVTEEDINKEIETLAKSSGEVPEDFRGKVGEGGLDYISDYLLRRKALDFLVASAKVS